MSVTRLTIAGFVALEGQGPPETEGALFAANERDGASWRTNVKLARERLAAAGVGAALAEAAGHALSRRLKEAYSRGPTVRRVAGYLGATELFEGGVWDGVARRYRGTWLDLEGLAVDAKLLRATTAFQALHLAALLAEFDDEAAIVLEGVSGEPRRPALAHAAGVGDALRRLDLTSQPVPPTRSKEGPSQEDLLGRIRERTTRAGSAAVQGRLLRVERALAVGERPISGPLADGGLWDLYLDLEVDPALALTDGFVQRIDDAERARGRLSGTAYLRARVALLAGREGSHALALRTAAVLEEAPGFAEATLLAAQAFALAGDRDGATAYAAAVVENGNARDVVRAQAREILADLRAGRAPVFKRGQALSPPPPPPSSADATGPATLVPDTTIEPAPIVHAVLVDETEPRKTRSAVPPPPMPRTTQPLAPALAPRVSAVRATPAPQVPARSATASPVPPAAPPSPPVDGGGLRLRGGSQPPMSTFAPPPPPPWPATPLPPRIPTVRKIERAQLLGLPPGLHGQPPPRDALPRNPTDARIVFTYLARDLARETMTRHKFDLHMDAPSLRFLQGRLRERFPDGVLRSDEDAYEVRRHGAYLSELLARTLGAYWVDMSPSEMGYWAMAVPPSTRIMPFGRVLRFLLVRDPGEPDLVSFYETLEARARRGM